MLYMSIKYVGPIIENAFNVDFNTIFAVIFRMTIAKYITLLK